MTIEVNNLSFAYGSLNVLHNISARAERGKIIAVVGPNAAGKSTLLRCIIGALRPISGEVTIKGVPAYRLRPRQLAEFIAYVPQRSIVSASFTVRQVVELGRYALPANPDRIDDALSKLDLVELQDRPYLALSIGQQQRVTLARAIAQLSSDGHLILDEPMSGMDLRHVRICVRLIRNLSNFGASIVIAMHDLALATSLADDVWLLNGGKLVASGPVNDVMTIDQLESVFGVGFQAVQIDNGKSILIADTIMTD